MVESENLQTSLNITERKLENPLGTDGFEFVEFASPKPKEMAELFLKMGFSLVAKHKSKEVSLYRQGHVNFILNNQPNSHATLFAQEHGPCACAMAFRVKDAQFAYKEAVSKGAKPFDGANALTDEIQIPAIYGIGGSVLYFVDTYHDKTIYDTDFVFENDAPKNPPGLGLEFVDHLTHNVHRGQMDEWANFYERIFNFSEIRYFDIEGKMTGLTSRAMSSPCGKIKIPLNQSKDAHSQIEEYLNEYKGEGIQHIALYTSNIYETVEAMRKQGTRFLTVPDTYYDIVNKRVPGHSEDLARLKKNKIIIDGSPIKEEGILLQIFTENVIGPIFFEIIQRKGNDGFGEGNFKALFESIELDQIHRGVLKEEG